jgi:ABC-type lipoprotein export system ATPase subunit/GNAT superfamily N-acetyltransferase
MHFNITKKNNIADKSFRVAQLYDQFDLSEDSFEEHFEGDIDLDREWQIGVIVGKSGTGKSTIAKELFADYFFTPEYKERCVIDDFPKMDSAELFSVLSSVGFSSPPSWLKPYAVLSNGEKMRVDLARAICEKKEIIVFDEYTSVVDREVAQVGSYALQRAVRKTEKKFIAVTCHFDILDWLEPDWVFNTDEMAFHYTRGCLQKPETKIEIYETRGFWEMFRRYHYLNHGINAAARCFVAFRDGKPILHMGMLKVPAGKGKYAYMGHRGVTLPDYQGIGVFQKTLNLVCAYLRRDDKNFEYILALTSNKAMARALMKNPAWRLTRTGHVGMRPENWGNNKNWARMRKCSSHNRNTYSFKYVGINDHRTPAN